jgi:predicted nucleic acid-binding protein
MDYLCDTNILSEAMRPRPKEELVLWLGKLEKIYLSVITIEEIYSGLAYKDAHKQQDWFEKFLQHRVEILPISTAIAKCCGEMRGQFRKAGKIRTQADLLIAATAFEHHLILATRNIKDFEDSQIELFNPFTN